MRALTSHQCGLSLYLGVAGICGLSLLLVLSLAPRGFSPGTPVFPSPQEPTRPNSNSIWNARTHFNEFLKSPSISWVNKYQFDRDGGDYDDDSGGDEDSDDNVDDGVMVMFNMPVRMMMMMMMKMTMIMLTIMMVMLIILGVNNGDNNDGNRVDNAGNDGDVDGHDVDANDNDGGDFDDSACQLWRW